MDGEKSCLLCLASASPKPILIWVEVCPCSQAEGEPIAPLSRHPPITTGCLGKAREQKSSSSLPLPASLARFASQQFRQLTQISAGTLPQPVFALSSITVIEGSPRESRCKQRMPRPNWMYRKIRHRRSLAVGAPMTSVTEMRRELAVGTVRTESVTVFAP